MGLMPPVRHLRSVASPKPSCAARSPRGFVQLPHFSLCSPPGARALQGSSEDRPLSVPSCPQ